MTSGLGSTHFEDGLGAAKSTIVSTQPGSSWSWLLLDQFALYSLLICPSDLFEDRELAEEIVAETSNFKGKTLTTEDVAEAALYLAGDESKYISGLNLLVEGGYTTTNIAFQVAVDKVLGGEGTN
nr:secoisolariciresinol dehydrogenase-like [Ipomoea batatas]